MYYHFIYEAKQESLPLKGPACIHGWSRSSTTFRLNDFNLKVSIKYNRIFVLDQRYTVKSRTKPLSSFSLCAHARNYKTSSATLFIFVFVSPSSDLSSVYDSSTTDLSNVPFCWAQGYDSTNDFITAANRLVMIPDTHGFIRYDSTNDFDFAEKIITYDLAELQSSSHMIPGQFDSLDKISGQFSRWFSSL